MVCLEKENGRYKVQVYKKDFSLDLLNEYYQKAIVHLVIMDNEYDRFGSEQNINNIHDLKKRFRGQTYLFYPIVFDSSDFIQTDEDKCIGYILISKRDLRTNFPSLKLQKTEYVKEIAYEIVRTMIHDLKLLMNGDVYHVVINRNGEEYRFDNVIAKDIADLFGKIVDKVDFIDYDFDKFIGEITNESN